MDIELKANRADGGQPLRHFWSVCVGAGRANEGLRAGWLEQLRLVHEACGFRYVRFHGLFHDDMFVYQERDGRAVYNFQYVDDLFDRILSMGVRPFVELGFCPGDLATEKATVFWWKANGSPPKNYTRWAELIGRITRHWVDRYGIGEVRQWRFEVWNEPNLNAFFKGAKSQYFELYRVTANAVKAIDAELRVGGPATSNFVPDSRFAGETEDLSQHAVVTTAKDLDALQWRPVWVAEFLNFCAREKLPVDFVSCHPYPTDWALDGAGKGVHLTRGVGATARDLAMIRQTVNASAFPRAEIHLTEWSSSPSSRDHTHDYLQAATFVVKANLESLGQVDSLSYWTFTDVFEEAGAGDVPFHGGFGLVNYQGIVKPTFHAYRFLHQLGDELLRSVPGGVVSRDSRTGKLTALLYHYPPEMPQSVPASQPSREVARRVLALGQDVPMTVRLEGLAPGAQFLVETLDQLSGNVVDSWQAIGSPEAPLREMTESLRKIAMATRTETMSADAEGNFVLRRKIGPWSMVLIRQL